jgi:DnaJ-domain-containing protein 1
MIWLRIGAVGLAVLLYIRSPIDLIPDRLGLFGLLDDLAVLLGFIFWARGQLRLANPPRRSSAGLSDGEWDPHRVLGIERGATRDEIAHAYREQMKRYHPDRVADLGEELQQLAHRKAVEIQRAYEELGKG